MSYPGEAGNHKSFLYLIDLIDSFIHFMPRGGRQGPVLSFSFLKSISCDLCGYQDICQYVVIMIITTIIIIVIYSYFYMTCVGFHNLAVRSGCMWQALGTGPRTPRRFQSEDFQAGTLLLPRHYCLAQVRNTSVANRGIDGIREAR